MLTFSLFTRDGFISLYHYPQSEHCWCLSGDVSAARALAIVATIRALSVFEGTFIALHQYSRNQLPH